MHGGKCRGEVCAERIAAFAPSCVDINDIGYAIAITNARVVYELDLSNFFWVKGQHLLLAHHNSVNSYLNASSVVDNGNCVVDVVDTKIGECELFKNAVAIVRCLLLSICGVYCHAVGSVHDLGCFYRYLM